MTSDAHVKCDLGHMHWGTNGAAGILLQYTDDTGHVFYFLAHRRASHFQNIPECYGIPGGAVDDDEMLWDGAMREFTEEIHFIYPFDFIKILHYNDHGNWGYTTFLAESPDSRLRIKNLYEHSDCGWFSKAQIDQLDSDGLLHPGFSETWNLCHHLL